MMPEVSRSRRCTIPGRSGSSPPATAWPSKPWTSVPVAWPAAGCTTRPAGLAIGRDEGREQDRDADDDEAVRKVERGPEAQVEEVGHVAEPHAVDQVREAPADDEPERDRQERVPGSRPGEEGEHPRHGQA